MTRGDGTGRIVGAGVDSVWGPVECKVLHPVGTPSRFRARRAANVTPQVVERPKKLSGYIFTISRVQLAAWLVRKKIQTKSPRGNAPFAR